MNLAFREANFKDFEAFYEALYRVDEDNGTRHQTMAQEWKEFLKHTPGLSMLVEDRERPLDDRIVGCAQTVFVTDAFVQYVCSGDAAPHINHRAIEPLPDASWPLLTPTQISVYNSGNGLNALNTRLAWRERLPDLDEQRCVREYMEQFYPLFYRGYQVKEILISAYGTWAYERLELAGFKMRNDFANYYNAHPEALVPYGHPYLFGVTREEALAQEGSYVSRMFIYTPPRIYFKPHEQELLAVALQEVSDEEAAEQLYTTIHAIKKRWNTIYDRVEEAIPGIMPPKNEEKRGQEKRRFLLRYLREHPEELRPVLPPRKR